MKKLMMMALVVFSVEASNVKADSMAELNRDCDAFTVERNAVNNELANALVEVQNQGFVAAKPVIKQVLQDERRVLNEAKLILARGKMIYKVNHSASLKQALDELEDELITEQNVFDKLSAYVNS